MKTMFNSTLAKHFSDFVKLRRVSGLDYSSQEKILLKFDRYLAACGHQGALPTQKVEAFLYEAFGKEGEEQKSRYYQVIRHFYDYLTVIFPEQCRLPIDEHRSISNRPVPRLFSDDELAAILRNAVRISRHNEIRNRTLHAALALAIACGLRRSEIVGLELNDVDTFTGTLAIRETKFGKSRIIPIGADLCGILDGYRVFRLDKYPHITTPRFFITMHKSALSASWLYQSFRELLCTLGLAPATGRAAHLHDLRHTFAVRAISAWYKSGRDVQELLPALATYMGHSHYSDTAYYLTVTAELLGFALDNFDKIWTTEVTYDED